jgi:putative ABC transport system permease protein
MTPGSPDTTRLPTPARLALRLLVGDDRRAEVEGDLLELRAERLADGRADLGRALIRDIVSIARLRLSRRFGSSPLGPHEPRPRLGVMSMQQDLRHALRLIRRQPAFASIVMLTLALGIAASTAIFTICDRVLFRPLPYPEPDRVVALDDVGFSFAGGHMSVSAAVRNSPAFSSVGLYATGGLNLGDDQHPARIRAAAVSSRFFGALGVTPLAGRTFTDDEDRREERVAVLAFETWRTRLGRRADILAQAVRLNGQRFQVIGVMPEGFGFPHDAGVWIPTGADSQITGEAFAPHVIARLAPGVTVIQAIDALTRLNEAQRAANPQVDFDPPRVIPLQEFLVGNRRPSLAVLAGVVALLLVATAANVAGLLLTRLRTRQREMQLRSALGASRARLARQLAIEAFVMTGVGGLAGIGLAAATVRWFAHAAPAFTPDIDLASVDLRFLATGLLVSLAAGVLFAAMPALTAGRRSAAAALRDGATASGRAGWTKSALVVVQVAAALVLLTVTTAALGVLVRLTRVDLGFQNDQAVVFELTLPQSRYPDSAAIARVTDDLVARLAHLPGIRHAGAAGMAPGSSAIGVGIALQRADAAQRPPGPRSYATVLPATPGYFRTIGIPILAGRAFADTDVAGAPPVVVLSESAARAIWPEPARAIGQPFRASFRRNTFVDHEVVGVVGDVRLRGAAGSTAQAYFPFAQKPPYGVASIAVDVAGDPEAILPAVREAIRGVDPDLPLYNITLLRDLRARFLATERITLALTGAFAAIAIALSALGLFGVLSQVVTQRTREIGIRMALGADRARLRLGVIGAGVRLAIAGAVVGIGGSILAARLIARFVPALDAPTPTAIGVDVVLLLVVALGAAWVPARRASGVDPVVALRSE